MIQSHIPSPSTTSSNLSGGQVAGIAAVSTSGAVSVPTLVFFFVKHLTGSESIVMNSENDSDNVIQPIVIVVNDSSQIADLISSFIFKFVSFLNPIKTIKNCSL